MEPTIQKHHAIFLPLPLQGHINPSINLSLKLASSKCFTITFLTFDFLHQQITQSKPNNDVEDIFYWARQRPNGLDIRYRSIPDGLPEDFDRSGVKMEEAVGWYLNGGVFDEVVKGVEDIMLNSKPKVDVLVIDTFFPWGSKIAKKFGLCFVSFWTEPALVFNIYWHVHLLKEHGHLDCKDTRKDPIDYIPGVNSIDPKDLTSYLQDKDITTNMHKLIFGAFKDVRKADIVLCNTIQELELDTISTLNILIPFYAIGPTLQLDSSNDVVSASLWPESNCLEWLSTKPNNSVLYVSFGSLANLNKSDVMEIAYGLIESNVNFIWVVRLGIVLGDNNDNILPNGFEDMVRGRGLIVGWTNQISILSHSAIGGFLTHCGWNSVLESTWYNVPMLCFPVFTDQFTNRKLVVDDWKVGVNFCNGKELNRREIGENVKNFMAQRKRDKLRENIDIVKKMLVNALGDGGSSTKNMNLFVEKLEA